MDNFQKVMLTLLIIGLAIGITALFMGSFGYIDANKKDQNVVLLKYVHEPTGTIDLDASDRQQYIVKQTESDLDQPYVLQRDGEHVEFEFRGSEMETGTIVEIQIIQPCRDRKATLSQIVYVDPRSEFSFLLFITRVDANTMRYRVEKRTMEPRTNDVEVVYKESVDIEWEWTTNWVISPVNVGTGGSSIHYIRHLYYPQYHEW